MTKSVFLEKFVKEKIDTLPDLISQKELIETGLFSSPVTFTRMRMNGEGPGYIKIGKQFKYLKGELREWLSEQYHTKTNKQ